MYAIDIANLNDDGSCKVTPGYGRRDIVAGKTLTSCLQDEYELGHSIQFLKVFPIGSCQYLGATNHVNGMRIIYNAHVGEELPRDEVFQILLNEKCPIDLFMALNPSDHYARLIDEVWKKEKEDRGDEQLET